MTNVVVIDYGMGNLRSVARALERSGAGRVALSSRPREIAAADRVVFPGQGAIGSCFQRLGEQDLTASVLAAARDKPFLGICLGLQALFDFSEEDGGTPGLSLLSGSVHRFPPMEIGEGKRLKVPHMGWNRVAQTREHPLWRGIGDGSWFYFVHSYYVRPAQTSRITGLAKYGHLEFCAAAGRDNLFAVQFHPEKSHSAGLALLANFIQWNGEFTGG